MEQEKVVYSGILLSPPQGKRLLKKTWQQKFCLLYKASKFGIERLEIYENVQDAALAKNTSNSIITLENCVKIMQKNSTYFTIVTKTSSYDFGTLTVESSTEWLAALQSVAFRDDSSKITSIEEDNDLYCSSGEGVFIVKLFPSEASTRCELEPIYYTLVLTASTIQLISIENNKLLFTWPFCFIRRYGYRDGKFTFEAGRKCETGEGTFHLQYPNQQEIFRCVASKMKSMKKMLNGETAPTILDCGDNQFHAALSMEARSRSPLPPSPTTSTTLLDLEPQTSNKSHKSTSDLSGKFSNQHSNHPPKSKPVKPPRKSLFTRAEKELENNFFVNDKLNNCMNLQTYEPVNKYDEVEYRNEAWRTLGTDDIKHTENISKSHEDVEKIISRSRNQECAIEQILPKASKIITQISSLNIDDSYDKLNFFGSSSKLNVAKSGYKQVSPAPALPIQITPTFNDYDEVEPSMEGIRPADDSHLGYALIRKHFKEHSVDHQFHNDDPYAIISKPKRV